MCCSKQEAKHVYHNFIQDCFTYEHYGTPYVPFMTKVIDCLINLQDKECNNPDRQDNDIGIAINTPDSQTMAKLEATGNTVNQDIGEDNSPKRNKRDLCDINDPHKSKGFIALQPTEFSFIGPDRQPTDTSGVDKYLEMALIIKKSGLPNYRQARIPLASGLNIEAWKRYLHNYPDQKLVQYLQYGFPLSIKCHDNLRNQNVRNHYSALQFPHAVEQYLSKELSEGAIIGPISQFGKNPGHEHIHFSPLLTRPKDRDKRGIILDLSFPKGSSLNDQVDRNRFDMSDFCLKFPSTDDIANEICRLGDDVTLAKIDVARAFRNLRVDPADAIKLGITWKNDAFIDISVAFGWVHRSAAFQRVSDAVTFIMTSHGIRMFAYIDDYILVSPRATANDHFQRLASTLIELGLPSNPDKQTSPCRNLTCLGIRFDLDSNTMSIDSEKLQAIYAECLATRGKRHLSRTAFQSLFGKLLYIHKCVRPARIFVNRILALFRAKQAAERIFLTPAFHSDLDWFLRFLPSYNGVTFLRKSEIPNSQTLHVDTSLTGLGGVWNKEVYATPIFNVYGFDLKIVHLEMLNLIIALKL